MIVCCLDGMLAAEDEAGCSRLASAIALARSLHAPAYGSTWDAAEKGRAGRSFHPDKYLKRKGKREKIPQMTV